jgi:hypothetical protein
VTRSPDHDDSLRSTDDVDRPATFPGTPENADTVEELVDEMVDESFPGSDPPSTWAGSDTPPAGRS